MELVGAAIGVVGRLKLPWKSESTLSLDSGTKLQTLLVYLGVPSSAFPVVISASAPGKLES